MNTKVIKDINQVLDGLYQNLHYNNQRRTDTDTMSKHTVSIILINLELK